MDVIDPMNNPKSIIEINTKELTLKNKYTIIKKEW